MSNAQPGIRPPADVQAFVQALEGQLAAGNPPEPLAAGREVWVARAPGRLDLMGGIADYSGSLVLQMPIAEAAIAAVQRGPRSIVSILSLPDRWFEAPLAEVLERPRDALRGSWAAYIAGVLPVLAQECGLHFEGGVRILLDSRVPEGKGVSSSAAIEVATMQAVAAAFGVELAAPRLAVLCQKVENQIVGAPCGLMDQMTAACGEAGRLLALLCQPDRLQGTVPLPADLSVWGLDSGIRHSVAGADYGSVRIGAFMGRRIAGWADYLANMTPSLLAQRYEAMLPDQITGSEFLSRYGSHDDPVTTIEPARTYAVRRPTTHPVHEHHRVQCFAEVLGRPESPARNQLLGELMYQSHASYSACGLGCPATDLLVELVRQGGPAAGLYGAKATGGGSGGTVAVLGSTQAGPAIRQLCDDFARQTGHTPFVFSGSSPGAAATGTIRITP